MLRVLNCLGTQHDWRLVILAGLVCFLVSGVAVSLIHRARALSGRARLGWLLTASFATGSGVWATHFIAMLAFDPGIPIAFDVGLTVLSLLVAVAVISIGLAIAIYGEPRWSAVAGGAIVGGGIACMHYLGIAAVHMPGVIVWATDLVVASIVLGIVFGAAALELTIRNETLRGNIAAAGVLTLAITSHHFVAMGAAGVIPGYVYDISPVALTPSSLALAVAIVTAVVLGLCMLGVWSDRRNRAQLKERNRWLDVAINNMVQGLCMFDAQNRLMVWNERYRTMYNIEPGKIWRGCTIRDLLDARTATGTFPLDSPSYDAELRAALQQGRTLALNIELADGRIVHVVNQPTEGGGWVATHEDITERKTAERELENARTFLDAIIENVPSPIIVKSLPDRRYVLINRAAENHLGLKRDTMLGKIAQDFMPADTAAMIDVNDQRLIEDGKPLFIDEHAIITPGNGTRIATSTRLPLFGADGKPQYLVSVIDDVTDRKRTTYRAYDAPRYAHRPAEPRGIQFLHRRHARDGGCVGRDLCRADGRPRSL
jgi:PAS domain S-box-containing protein